MSWEKIKLDDALGYIQPGPFIVESTNYDDSFKTPVLTPGKSFLLGYTDEKDGVFNDLPTIIFDDFTTAFKYVDFPFKVKSSAMKMLKEKSDKYDIKFLYYLMLSTPFEVGEHKRHWISKYSQQFVKIPPLEQQKKIAAILDAADAYRQKTKALIAKYDELTQSLFLDMFGDPVTNPKGWEKEKFGDLVENKDSKRVPIKSADRDNSEGTTPYYGASGVIDFVEGFTHEGDNLLIGEDGANLVTRTKPIAFIAKGKYWVNNHAHVLGENGSCKLKYLEFFINSIDLKPYVSGSAQPKLNRKNMDSILVSNPPIELQNQFAKSVQAIETQKAQAQSSLEKAEELFNSLLQRAFKGELA